MKTVTKTRALGGSLIVTIPKKLADEEGIMENEFVEIDVTKLKRSFFGAAKGIGSFTKEDEMNSHD